MQRKLPKWAIDQQRKRSERSAYERMIEQYREADKLEHETAKAQAFMTAPLLAAAAGALFLQDVEATWLLALAGLLGLASLMGAITHMHAIEGEIRGQTRGIDRSKMRFSTRAYSEVCFFGAIFLLGFFVIQNAGL